MLSCERQLLTLQLEEGGGEQLVHAVDDGTLAALFHVLGERQLTGLDVIFWQFATNDGIVVPIDERIVCRHVLNDAELGVDVVLHAEVVTVEVVGGDVEQDGDVGLETVHVVELERAELDDVDLVGLLCHLEGERVADVASQTSVYARLLEDVVYERGGSGLSVAARYAHHLGVGVTACKLDLADDVDALGHGFLDHRCLLGYARTLYDLVGSEDALLAVVLLLPLYVVVVEHLLIFVLYC